MSQQTAAVDPEWCGGGFLGPPESTESARSMVEEDRADLGYVMDLTRVWAHLPDQHEALFGLVSQAAKAAGLTLRERGVLVTAMASTLGDAYCSLAWGAKLAGFADDASVAAGVLTGTDEGLSERERALATWARRITVDPNATGPEDLDALRAVGYDDTQIVAITLFVGLRQAFSTVNDALGATPDRELLERVPTVVRDAVTWGRTPAD